ncbi:carboxypeptidase-like regulatory domain-containing protein [Hymenobacter setariae]|uniref:Carboxypeptidase-like regulatory domain-containing protein n=1 Tax=Hymenobacter setariae TaxID=2594794 RepID=A0A558BNZ1_9BACT|nr:carboxypeptidase-like regulatory domain-containing protein [Hymenobacter setariae]TVT38240.1 carboxypeptidase-like regulatory domain-containing protein [Hymenobacter setariae]
MRRLFSCPFFPPHLGLFLVLISSLLLSRAALGQAGAPTPTVRVSGTISAAATREPIPGATVQVQRTRRGVAANVDGDFLLTALPTDTLLFRALGFKPKRFALSGTSLSQLVVQVALVRDSVKLSEVKVTADRPDRASINRALRNIKRPAPAVVKVPKKAPPPKPLFAVDSTAPKAEKPTVAESNVDWLYDQFSHEGKERRKMEAVKAAEAAEKARQARSQYNKAFRDNRGYE